MGFRGWLAGLLLAASSACATQRKYADDAYSRGDYLDAAELYAQLAETSPDDDDLRARRDDARARALEAATARVRQARAASRLEEAMRELVKSLDARDRWALRPGPALAAAIAAEVTWARGQVTGEIEALLGVRRPLSAETALARRRAQLFAADFAALWPSLTAAVRAGAETAHQRAASSAGRQGPYLTRLVSAYGEHFGASAAPASALPHALAGFDLRIDIEGLPAAQRAELEGGVGRALRDSAWYGEGGARVSAALTGSHSARFSSTPRSLEQPWVENVPYEDTESYQEPHQEAYTDQESYTEQVPYTTMRSESYSCGDSRQYRTCTRSVPETHYRTEFRHRTVTRFRTVYRTAWRTVTRYRPVPRVYRYSANERAGEYRGDWALKAPLGSGEPLLVRLSANDRRRGLDHDANFAQANLSPSRADLPTAEQWFDELSRRFSLELSQGLSSHWQASFCREPAYNAETAARCAYGSPAPPEARAALAPVFGGDVDQVLEAFGQKSPGR
jgi:hypothetical protein